MTTNETSISSATLTYGSGNCSIIGTEIQGVQIHYTGIVKITKTCDDNFHIAASHNKILIFPIGLGSLTTLFDYIGEFKIKSVIVNTPVNSISEPVMLPENILIFMVRDKRVIDNNLSLEEMKNQLINSEKNKILNMHSLSHYDKVRRSITVKIINE